MPPVYALKVSVGTTQITAYLDPATGRPDTQIAIVSASYQLVELATGKTVVNDETVCPCRLRCSGLAAAVRQPACAARRGRNTVPFKRPLT